MSVKTTKKTDRDADMRSEYHFDYSKARPNRFAAQFGEEGSVAIVLDPDVASVFRSSESVNALLRSVIAALPDREQENVTNTRGK